MSSLNFLLLTTLLLCGPAKLVLSLGEFGFDGSEDSEEASLVNNFGQRWQMSTAPEGVQQGGSPMPVVIEQLPASSGVSPKDQSEAKPNKGGTARRLVRRQIGFPMDVMAPGQQQPAQSPPKQEQSGVLKFLSDLGPQVQRAEMVSSLLSGANLGNNAGGQSGPGGAGGQQQNPAFNAAQMMSQLSSLIRATQDRNARALEAGQQSADQAAQQTAGAARQAQGGIQSALTEIGTGLQRLAANNPNLLPDVKNLYQSVSAKLSSASNSVAQVAAPQKNGAEQFAEQLAKAGQV